MSDQRSEQKDKTDDAFRKASELKKNKIKGQMILYFDGSGIISRAEVKTDL